MHDISNVLMEKDLLNTLFCNTFFSSRGSFITYIPLHYTLFHTCIYIYSYIVQSCITCMCIYTDYLPPILIFFLCSETHSQCICHIPLYPIHCIQSCVTIMTLYVDIIPLSVEDQVAEVYKDFEVAAQADPERMKRRSQASSDTSSTTSSRELK